MSIISNLNSAQKEAVLHQNSPLLILAGAGTGKTKVLTTRIVYLINSYLANPYQILAVTFTNKAAKEMRLRIFEQIGDLGNNIWMGTFHSIATRILKRHPEVVGLKSDFTIINSDDSLRLIKKIIEDFNVDNKEFLPKNYQYQIERLKDKALLPEDLSANFTASQKLPKFLEIYHSYQNRLRSLNCADFGDLLLYNLKTFAASPDTLQYYQNKFCHILVDEYQDTNNAQYQWLLYLSGRKQSAAPNSQQQPAINNNICAVGDDDQSIYSWRGAEIANILRFEKDFLNTKIIRLEQNYRSTSNILKVASHLISHNKTRHKKTLWTSANYGEKIKLLNFSTDRTEASSVAEIIYDLQKKEKINLNQIAILVRAGYQTRSFEEIFMANGLEYRIVGGLKFYDRKEIKDAIAYLRVIQNFSDDLALERIINLPKRGIGGVGIKNLTQRANNEKVSLFLAIKKSVADGSLKGKSKESLACLIDNLEKWQDLIATISVSDLTKQLLQDSGYILMWQNEKTPDAITRVENLQEFTNVLTEFNNLAEFLEHISLVSGDKNSDDDKEMVNIMTVHSAKGLEFDVVFIPGLEEGVFPSGRAVAELNGMEEERRLLYVAITRAKKLLYLSFAQSRFVFGQMQSTMASPFLKELPQEVISQNFAPTNFYHQEEVTKQKDNFLGERVFHKKFGYGEVLEVDGEKLQIKFEKSNIKIVMKNFVVPFAIEN
jgi:DNA helicase-2/ATP-dependent DNA helicase PcrA